MLSCDWLDDDAIMFANEERSPLNRTGCHVPVERETEGLPAGLLEGPEDEQAGHFDCFDSEGHPQGCHAYAKQRLAHARFRVGCCKKHKQPS